MVYYALPLPPPTHRVACFYGSRIVLTLFTLARQAVNVTGVRYLTR